MIWIGVPFHVILFLRRHDVLTPIYNVLYTLILWYDSIGTTDVYLIFIHNKQCLKGNVLSGASSFITHLVNYFQKSYFPCHLQTYVADIFFGQEWNDHRLRLPSNMTREYQVSSEHQLVL